MEISASNAADLIGVDRSRVLHWLRAGDLAGRKLGNVWLVDQADASLRATTARSPGRPMAPARAWGLLDHLDGGSAPWLTAVARSQVRALLRELVEAEPPSAARWRGLLRARSQIIKVHVHPSALGRMLQQPGPPYPAGAQSGAAAGIDVVALGPVEHLYLPAEAWPGMMRRWHLDPSSGEPNLVLHVPVGVWPFEGRDEVSGAAIAADLLESAEPRAVSGGLSRLNALARSAHAQSSAASRAPKETSE